VTLCAERNREQVACLEPHAALAFVVGFGRVLLLASDRAAVKTVKPVVTTEATEALDGVIAEAKAENVDASETADKQDSPFE